MNQDIPVLIYSRTHIGPIQYIHTQYYIHVTSYCNSISSCYRNILTTDRTIPGLCSLSPLTV